MFDGEPVEVMEDRGDVVGASGGGEQAVTNGYTTQKNIITKWPKSDQLIFRQVFIEMDQDKKRGNLFTQRGHIFM